MSGSGVLEGVHVAFTGVLAEMSRREAFVLVRAHGGEPVARVSGRTGLLVVGLSGWRVLRAGPISGKLARAEALQGAGHAIEILSEHAFLERLGRRAPPPGSGAGTCWAIERACRVLGIETATLRRWEQFGLVRSRDGALDFQDLVGLRALVGLIREGMTPAAIARGLDRLGRLLPEAQRPLVQMRLIADGGRELAAELEGLRMDVRGQLLLDLPEAAKVDGTEAERLFDEAYETAVEGRPAEAAELYRRALALDADMAEAHYNLANLLSRGEDPTGAERHYRTALELDPELTCAWYNLGYLLDELGRVEEAVRALRAALVLEPAYAEAQFNLALCYERLGRRKHAADAFRAYLRLDPASEWARIARRHLAALERLAPPP